MSGRRHMAASAASATALLGILSSSPSTAQVMSGEPPTRPVGIDEAVAIALGQSSMLHAARARVSAEEHATKGSAGRFFPVLSVSDEYQHYDRAFSIASPLFGGTSFVARGQDVNTLALSANQPLLGLIQQSQDYLAQRATSEAAAADLRTSEAALRHAVRVTFLRYFEAVALEQIAQASERELQDRLQVAREQRGAGAATEADVLRVEVAVASVRQQAIEARSQRQTLRASLLAAMGLPAGDESIVFAEPDGLLAAASQVPAYASATAAAQANRPELASARGLERAARFRYRSRLAALLPRLDLEGAYLHMTGQPFVPRDSAFVGLRLSWPFWEWGATFYASRAADWQAQAAALNVDAQAHQVDAEVASGLVQLGAAGSAVQVSQTAIASAEEAYRVTMAQLSAGAATTTDLLTAQAALTQARLNAMRARYELAIARVSLERALGR